MAKGLFTSLEEIAFQNAYVRGNINPTREPNAGRNPAKARFCAKKPKKIFVKKFSDRIR